MMVIVILTMVMLLLPSPYEHHMGNNALTEEEEIMDSLLTESKREPHLRLRTRSSSCCSSTCQALTSLSGPALDGAITEIWLQEPSLSWG